MPFIPQTEDQQQKMLKEIGAASIDRLFDDIPEEFRLKKLNIPAGMSEQETKAHLQKLAHQNNADLVSFLGCGFYDHFIPAAVDALSSRSEFYTAYTPYQPEASQGLLQTIFEYQTAICRLTGMDASNASLYDGGSAIFEAVTMAIRITGRNKVVVDTGVNPIYRKMLYSYTRNLAIDFVEVDILNRQVDRDKIIAEIDEKCAAVVLQNPNFFGTVDDFTDIASAAKSKGCLTLISVYPISLGLLKSPASMGADIVTGEGQSLGMPLSFGGPYLGFIACAKQHVRRMPGRIVGRTKDAKGRDGFVLTLQAREQHIRREKATSNICSNEALCAARAVMYLALLGKQGLADLALSCARKAEYAKSVLDNVKGIEVKKDAPAFNEFVIALPRNADDIATALLKKGFAPGFPLGRYYKGMDNLLLVAVTEKRTQNEIEQFAKALETVL